MAITHYLEIMGFIVGVFSAIMVLKRNPKYLANRCIAIGVFLIGVYMISIFIYDIIGQYWAVSVFLRIGMISLLFGDLFIFYTMMIIVHSAVVFKEKKITYLNLVFCIGASVYFIVADFIHIRDSFIGNVNIQIDIIPLGVLLLLLFYQTITASIIVQFKGINRTQKNSHQRKPLIFFQIGLIIFIATLIVNIFAQIVTDDYIGALLDVLTFAMMFVGQIFLAYAFSGRSKKKTDFCADLPVEITVDLYESCHKRNGEGSIHIRNYH